MDKNEVVLEVKNLSIDIPVSQGVLHAVDKVNLQNSLLVFELK